MPTKTTRRRSTKSLGYEGRSESVLTPAKRAPNADADEEDDEEEEEEEEEAGLDDVEAMAGPREEEPTPFPPPPRCEAAVSSLTSASRLLVGLSPSAGVAAAAEEEEEEKEEEGEEYRRGRAGRRGRVERGGGSVVGLALVCLAISGEEHRERGRESSEGGSE